MIKMTSAASTGITVEYPPGEPRQSPSSAETLSKNQHTTPAVTIAVSTTDIGNM